MIRRWLRQARGAARHARRAVLALYDGDDDGDDDPTEEKLPLEGLVVTEAMYLYVTGPSQTDTYEIPLPKRASLLFSVTPIAEDQWYTRVHPAYPREEN